MGGSSDLSGPGFYSWAMSSLVPPEAQQWKAKVLPFFEDFASTCSSFRPAMVAIQQVYLRRARYN